MPDPGEGGFGTDAALVGPADDQLRRDDRSDTWLLEQPWCERPHMGEDLRLQLGGFLGRRLDAAGEGAQHERCGLGVWGPRA